MAKKRLPGSGFWGPVGVLLAIATTASAQDLPAPVAVRAIDSPQAFTGSDGLRHLAYELDISNFYTGTGRLKLSGVSVFSADSPLPLASISGPGLADILGPNAALEPDNSLAIDGGAHAVVFLWLTLPNAVHVPARLTHTLTFKTTAGAIETARDIPVDVDRTPPVVIGPPVHGGLWLADEGPGNAQSHHWGSLVAENGRVTIPQRFAADWFGLDPKGHAVRAPIDKLAQTKTTDWVGYGSDILAVADGIVRDSQTDIPEHAPLSPLEEPATLTARALYGNFIIIEIAPGVYAHYAHLRPGSVRVKIGDHVHRGDVLAQLSDTGSAGAPHLHFHVSNTAAFADSQGLPFVFDTVTLAGRSNESDALNAESTINLDAAQAQRLQQVLPLNGDLIGFGP